MRTVGIFKPPFHQSHIGQYIMCPKGFKFAYIDEIKPDKRGAKMIFGSAAHYLMKLVHQPNANIEELIKLESLYAAVDVAELKPNPDYPGDEKIPVAWDDSDKSNRGKQIEKWSIDFQKTLENYWKNKHNSNAKIILAEAKFRVTIAGFPFEGRIDQLRETPRGTWILVDYKSGASGIDKVELEVDYQYSIYGYALMHGEFLINNNWISLGRYPDFIAGYRLMDHLPYKRKTTSKNGTFNVGEQRGPGMYLAERKEADYEMMQEDLAVICRQIMGPHFSYKTKRLEKGGAFGRHPNNYMGNCAMCGFRQECITERRDSLSVEDSTADEARKQLKELGIAE